MQRFTGFYRISVQDGTREYFPFSAYHFKAAGMPFSPLGGMPMIEAFQLVNEWNQAVAVPRDVYAL